MPRSEGDLNIPSRTPSPRSSASQAPPNPRHNAAEPAPRVNIHPSQPLPSSYGSSHPFKGLSRKFMGGSKSGHQRGRSEGSKVYDLGPSNQPPNVKDRVRKWQEAVTPGEEPEIPPISPATPTPGKRVGSGMREHVPHGPSGLATEFRPMGPRSAMTDPLPPPRGPALVNREEWDSASDAEKDAERMRAKSRDRETKLKRRRAARPGSSTRVPERTHARDTARATPVTDRTTQDRTTQDRSRARSRTPEIPPIPAAAAEAARPTSTYDDDGIRVAPIVDDNDGIRVTAIKKPKRRTSGARRRKRNQEEREAKAAEEAARAAEEQRKAAEEGSKIVAEVTKAKVVPTPQTEAKPVEKKPEPPKEPPKTSINLADVLRPAERPADKPAERPNVSRIPSTALPKVTTTPLGTPLAMYQVDKWDDEDDGIRVTSGAPKFPFPDQPKDDNDGIRVFPSPSNSPAPTATAKTTKLPAFSNKLDTPVVRSGPAYRQPSVRQSARSVKSRKEAFEAQTKKEQVAKDGWAELVRNQEEEDRLNKTLSEEKLNVDSEVPLDNSPMPKAKTTDAAREEMLRAALKPLADDGIRVQAMGNDDGIRVQAINTNDGIRVEAIATDDGIRVQSMAKEEPVVKEQPPKAKSEIFDDGIRVTPSILEDPPKAKSEIFDDGIRVRPMKDEFDDGIRVKPLKAKRNRRKRSSEKLKQRPKSMPVPIDIAEAAHASESEMTEPLRAPDFQPTDTESAPAEQTERPRRMRRDTEPSTLLSVKDRARKFDQGDPWVIESDTAPTTSPTSSKPRRSVDDAEPARANTKRRPPKDHGVNKEDGMSHEERRQHRRELRRDLEEAEEERLKIAQFRAAQKKLDAAAKEGRKEAATAAKDKQKEMPKVPARPAQKTKPNKSMEDLKRQKTKSAPHTPSASTESLPIRPRDHARHSTDLDEGRPYRQFKERSASPGYPRMNAEPKSKPANPLVPKLAAAAGSFFKIVKEELQGRSVRTVVEPVVSSSDDEPLQQDRVRGAHGVESEESSISSSEESSTQSDTESERGDPKKSKGKHPAKNDPPKNLAVRSFVSEEDSISEPESEAKPRRRRSRRRRRRRYSRNKKTTKSDDSHSSSDSIAAPGPVLVAAPKAPSPEPVVQKPPSPKITRRSTEPVKTVVSDTTDTSSSSSPSSSSAEEATKQEVRPPPLKALRSRRRRRRSSVRTSSPPAATPPPVESPSTFEFPESSAIPKPRRQVRNKTTPPRPKSLHSRAGSEGSISVKTSLYGDDASSIADIEPMRNISDASSIKPLRFTKSKPEPIHVRKSSRGSNRTPPPPIPVIVEPEILEDPEDWYNPEVSVKAPGLRRKFTKHADLISILSVDRPESPRPSSQLSGRSRRSRRSHRSRPNSKPHSGHSKPTKVVETLSIADLVKELTGDEVRYMRELKILVENVVPVLFQTVLGRADDHLRRTTSTSSVGTSVSGLSGASLNSRGFQANPTRPIVDMGITLERLKSLHERLQAAAADTDQLMAWATDARRVYEEYLSVWRMGFQDVVISMSSVPEDEQYQRNGKDSAIRKDLTVLHGAAEEQPMKFEGDMSTWALPPPPVAEDAEEDEKVDVAFLLKRPLVRLKALAKLFKRIHYLTSSPIALSLSNGFYDLVTLARKKISEEKARIEDEVAAGLDVSKVIDIRMLLPRHDITLDQTRRVKARDSFNMRLYHTSGELLERPIEIILRDPSPRSRQSEAEILIVETGEGTSKWLLFPPVAISTISARIGDATSEIVVMVRGLDKDLQEWKEVMALASETAAVFEWVQMLGLQPVPPQGPFTDEYHEPTYLDTVAEESVVSMRPHAPIKTKKQRKHALEASKTKMETRRAEATAARLAQAEAMAAAAAANAAVDQNAPEVELAEESPIELAEEGQLLDVPQFEPPEWLPSYMTAIPFAPYAGYKDFAGSYTLPSGIDYERETAAEMIWTDKVVQRSASLHTLADGPQKASGSLQRSRRASRPSNASRRNSLLMQESEADADDGTHGYMVSETTLRRTKSVHYDDNDIPSRENSPEMFVKSPFDKMPVLAPVVEHSVPPPVPPHRSPSPSGSVTLQNPPSPDLSVRSGFNGRRRTSSPLKHQWDPSSSGSDSGTEIAPVQVRSVESMETITDQSTEDEYSSEYDSSDSQTSSGSSDEESELCSEEEDEAEEYPHPMLSIPRNLSRKPSLITITRAKSVLSIRSKADDTSTVIAAVLEEEEEPSLSQPPDMRPPPVPQQLGYPFGVTIFKWVTNSWEKTLPADLKVVITPGLIEAFPLVASPDGYGVPQIGGTGLLASMQKLLWSLDLAHGIPVRRGTAVDISIKTPTTSFFKGANIMLRSRSPNECASLFAVIIDNITRPIDLPEQTMISTVVPSEMGTSVTSSSTFTGTIKRGFGWGRSKSYRAGSTPSLVSTPSQTSVNSLSSAFSKLRPSFFKNSSLGSVASSSSTSLMGSRGAPPIELSEVVDIGNWVIAMQPLKMRLYRRETNLKWRDMGNARLHVLKPPEVNTWDDRKRVVVTNRKGGVIHLDQALGEAAFERIARTGMAVNILTGEGEADGSVKHHGGIGAKNSVYMFQMKSEIEATHSFSVLGKNRY